MQPRPRPRRPGASTQGSGVRGSGRRRSRGGRSGRSHSFRRNNRRRPPSRRARLRGGAVSREHGELLAHVRGVAVGAVGLPRRSGRAPRNATRTPCTRTRRSASPRQSSHPPAGRSAVIEGRAPARRRDRLTSATRAASELLASIRRESCIDALVGDARGRTRGGPSAVRATRTTNFGRLGSRGRQTSVDRARPSADRSVRAIERQRSGRAVVVKRAPGVRRHDPHVLRDCATASSSLGMTRARAARRRRQRRGARPLPARSSRDTTRKIDLRSLERAADARDVTVVETGDPRAARARTASRASAASTCSSRDGELPRLHRRRDRATHSPATPAGHALERRRLAEPARLRLPGIRYGTGAMVIESVHVIGSRPRRLGGCRPAARARRRPARGRRRARPALRAGPRDRRGRAGRRAGPVGRAHERRHAARRARPARAALRRPPAPDLHARAWPRAARRRLGGGDRRERRGARGRLLARRDARPRAVRARRRRPRRSTTRARSIAANFLVTLHRAAAELLEDRRARRPRRSCR